MSASLAFRDYADIILDGLADEPGREILVSGEHRLTAREFRSLVHRLARALLLAHSP